MAGRKHTDEQVQNRRHVVEECMIRGDWTLARQAQIARSYNVSTAQVRKDAAQIRRDWANEHTDQTVDEIKSDWRQRVHKAAREASERGNDSAVAKLLSIEARVIGIEAAVQVDVNHTHTHTIEDAPRLAAQVIRALPTACEVLGIETPALPVIDLDVIDVDPVAE
jgi:hypothetical protein